MFREGTAPHGNVNFVSGEIIKKKHSSQDMKILYLIRKQRDHTERYFLWFIVPKMGVVNRLKYISL